jgi:16S rRNA (guanine1207-N2)-methyltransferase
MGHASAERVFAARPAEQILIESAGEIAATRILCTSLGRGQFAAAAARLHPAAAVRCCFLDLYALKQARAEHPETPANLQFECRADFPEEDVDAFVMPLSASGDTELVRECLRAGHTRLRRGGTMFVATDNTSDRWTHDELRNLFAKVTRRPEKRGVLYVACKTEPLRKTKSYEACFSFPDQGRSIQAITRPGVFSHRRLDGGARALLRAANVRAGDRVLEFGCGCGAVALALSARAEGIAVSAVDSNIRAAECARRGAELNGLTNVTVAHELVESMTGVANVATHGFDLVLSNPPYFSNYRIAEIFARQSASHLKPGGTALFVAKQREWYEENLPKFFASVAVEPSGDYLIVRARQSRRLECPGASPA